MILTVTANPAVDVAYFVDSFKMGDVHRPVKTVTTAGGKGLNVARVITLLGEDALAMGFVGGNNGAFIQGEVDRLGIKNSLTEIKGETRRNTDIIDADGNIGEILEAGPVISSEEESAFFDSFAKEVEGCDFICASGSLPQGLDTDFYSRLVAIAKEKGKKILVDTSSRSLEAVIQASPYMIKPNKDELSKLLSCSLDSDADVKDALKTLYKKGIEVPFVTLGGDGAIMYDGKDFYRYIIPKVEIKNTVGSGDSSVAGLSVGICRGMAICNAVRLGMASGVANTQFEQTGMVSKELVDKFYNDIKIDII